LHTVRFADYGVMDVRNKKLNQSDGKNNKQRTDTDLQGCAFNRYKPVNRLIY
jgi:hypothetical protein